MEASVAAIVAAGVLGTPKLLAKAARL